MGSLKRLLKNWVIARAQSRWSGTAAAAESDCGRSEGWDIELEGRVIGRLDAPRREDLFWASYHLTATTDDPALAAALLSEAFWRGDGWARLIFRSRVLGLAAAKPFPSIHPFVAPARLNMRGLYIKNARE